MSVRRGSEDFAACERSRCFTSALGTLVTASVSACWVAWRARSAGRWAIRLLALERWPLSLSLSRADPSGADPAW